MHTISINLHRFDDILDGNNLFKFSQTCKDLGLSTAGTSKGLCLLFYGPSGTGEQPLLQGKDCCHRTEEEMDLRRLG